METVRAGVPEVIVVDRGRANHEVRPAPADAPRASARRAGLERVHEPAAVEGIAADLAFVVGRLREMLPGVVVETYFARLDGRDPQRVVFEAV